MDFVYHSTLGLRVIKKKKKRRHGHGWSNADLISDQKKQKWFLAKEIYSTI